MEICKTGEIGVAGSKRNWCSYKDLINVAGSFFSFCFNVKRQGKYVLYPVVNNRRTVVRTSSNDHL
jgi:hypothetical protein